MAADFRSYSEVDRKASGISLRHQSGQEHSLKLRQANRTVSAAKLKAPRKVAKTRTFKLANGVVVRWRGRNVLVSSLPPAVSGVWLRLNGKVKPFVNPARRTTTTHSVRLTDRQNTSVKINRSIRISAKPGSAK